MNVFSVHCVDASALFNTQNIRATIVDTQTSTRIFIIDVIDIDAIIRHLHVMRAKERTANSRNHDHRRETLEQVRNLGCNVCNRAR